MKKKYFYGVLTIIALLTGFYVITPTNANALTVKPSLSCTNKVSKNNTVTCSVSVDASDGTLTKFSANLSTDGSIITKSSDTISSDNGSWTGNAKILTFTVSSGAKSGKGSVSLTNMTVTDSSGAAGTISGSTTLSAGITVLNDDSTLKEIKVNHAAITGFNPTKKNYTLSANTKSIKLSASANDSNAIVSGTGTKNLKCGSNSISINVKAEDNSSTKYTITVKRSCNNSSIIKDLTVSSGTLTPVFTSDVKEYTVKVDKDIDKITINATKDNVNQVITGIGENQALKYGDNKFPIKVTAEDGTTTTYNLTVTREDSRSTNTYLSSITLSDGNIEFNKDTTDYQVRVLNSVNSITVVATPEDATAKVNVVGGQKLEVGENKITVKVVSEKGDEKEYTITVTRLKEGETLGDNANIKSLTITGYPIDFLSSKTDYTIKIGKEKTLSISVILDDETSKYEILGNSDLKNGSVITIKVTSLDGTIKEYKINIEKDSYTLYIIIAAVSFGLALILLIYLIIKKKKNKDEFNTEGQPTTTVEENVEIPTGPITQVDNTTTTVDVNQNDLQKTIVMPTVEQPTPEVVQPAAEPNPVISIEGVMKQAQSNVVAPNPVVNEQAAVPVQPQAVQETVTTQPQQQVVTPEPVIQTPVIEQAPVVQQTTPVAPVEPIVQAPPVQQTPVIEQPQPVVEPVQQPVQPQVVQQEQPKEMPSVADILKKAAQQQQAATKKCSVCGHDVAANAIECPYCKAKI